MKKFVTAIIISFVVTVSSAGIKAAAFSSSNLGAAFVLSNDHLFLAHPWYGSW